MFANTRKTIDIDEIIRSESILIYFQPIVSIRRKFTIGLEALCRGVCDGEIISPVTLFQLAERNGLTLELDRLCRKKALEAFACLNRYRDEYILFINFDSSIVDQGVVGSGNILDTVKSFDINPNNIIIEINEAKANNVKELEEFINIYKSHGFMIALDDIGAGYSNLSRLAIVKPDILKIDMALVRNIDSEFYKQEVVKSLVSLSKKIGSLVVAEGVETEEEAIAVLDIGVDMLQGYCFSKPSEVEKIDFDFLTDKKQLIASEYKRYALQKANSAKIRRQEFALVISEIADDISMVDPEDFDEVLAGSIMEYEKIECLFVLSLSGIQCSETICNYMDVNNRKKTVFSPAPKGTDHSLKDYYYQVMINEYEIYITEPYISLATGSLCATISILFSNLNHEKYILCIDTVME